MEKKQEIAILVSELYREFAFKSGDDEKKSLKAFMAFLTNYPYPAN